MSAVVVRRAARPCAEPEEPAGASERRVRLGARDDPQPRRALQSLGRDIPAGVGEHRVTSRRQAGEVGRLTAVTNLTPLAAGRPRRSRTQPAATTSATVSAEATGVPPQFWSQADVSQSAATATGSAPPMTKPKQRGPAEDLVAPVHDGGALQLARSPGL
jgi:hypothetical protein